MNHLAASDTLDTIAAISTPLGQGGLGIVRISGPDSLPIADKVFRCKEGLPSSLPTHTVHHGQVVAEGQVIDTVLLTVMRGPRTYTGEDTVELSCHGGRLILHKTLAAAIKAGARPANPGEFTMRAFLNGKLDLSQAEAVQQLIGAQSELALRVASQHLQGKLRDTVETIRSQIVEVAAVLEASIDFPEEDIEISSREELCGALSSAKERVSHLLATYEDGVKVVEGVNVVIAGKPNVGKSTLLNALLEKDVAITTPVPGTTRDVLKESLILQGVSFNLFDTAGIRKPKGIVEKEGVRRSKKALRDADVVLLVLDAEAGVSSQDHTIFRETEDKRLVVVVNKIDLVPEATTQAVAGQFKDFPLVCTSALKSSGIGELRRTILEKAWSAEVPPSQEIIITSLRHRDALRRADESFAGAIKALRDGLSPEFAAVELREALDAIGLITGETTDEEILDTIFSKFCIGK
jgi:tRNA modification GTPase